ncbi:bifunctional protein tyrosine phosphatase family protein/NAD(P)/FAD-dependent oxidoreductase [Acidocella facilis]|uniref:bifunctional protein tyrosine phosphatase family protein/NAD(P)/FAD-dependent oxidoreductase n=1 Tax=Acidocella facilis TaxID=525 RepID=UPI001F3DED36|nr:bifunctional protein tyrosine phosphatase family protein/NAD(P)/FAD-dependent oxidoreductase [Acidocella facilis]
MEIRPVTADFSVTPQLQPQELQAVADQGFKTVICTRPDGEDANQPSAAEIEAACAQAGLGFAHVPVASRAVGAEDVGKMARALASLPGPVLGYCRSGARAETLYLAVSRQQAAPSPCSARIYDVVIVGGGSGGIATAASLLKRKSGLSIAVIEPMDVHYYQPGWTLVGAGVFQPQATCRPMAQVMPKAVQWLRASVSGFAPEQNRVILGDGSDVAYRTLVVSPGLRLAWEQIPGLQEALGCNGVTSNYRFDLAPYTNRLSAELKSGRALFTQPPMPIKCAGAPQKAMYLSCDRWLKAGHLSGIQVEFHNAGAVLFGVPAYVPALMSYVQRYGIELNFESRLVAVDGGARLARFERKTPDGVETIEREFDMLHAVPPQVAPDCVRTSKLAGPSGFVAVNEATLQHPDFPNVFALGDGCAAPNAKTAAAVRQQAPVVAVNVLAQLAGKPMAGAYLGYGSCPLTVERGRIVLAEFSYGGKVTPTFPRWVVDGTRPTRAAWFLKDRILPTLYWHDMLKGREWLAAPKPLSAVQN